MKPNPKFIVAAMLSGASWGVIAYFIDKLVNNSTYFGENVSLILIAGTLTGPALSFISRPIYRKRSPGQLLWWAPMSIYIAVAIFTIVFFISQVPLDLKSIPMRIYAVWFGVTLVPLPLTRLPIVIVLIPVAWYNHRLMRWIYRGQA